MLQKNVQKRKAQPKRPVDNPGLGLWIDYDPLRTQHHTTIAHGSVNNHYLALADLALGNNRAKRKKANTGMDRANDK